MNDIQGISLQTKVDTTPESAAANANEETSVDFDSIMVEVVEESLNLDAELEIKDGQELAVLEENVELETEDLGLLEMEDNINIALLNPNNINNDNKVEINLDLEDKISVDLDLDSNQDSEELYIETEELIEQDEELTEFDDMSSTIMSHIEADNESTQVDAIDGPIEDGSDKVNLVAQAAQDSGEQDMGNEDGQKQVDLTKRVVQNQTRDNDQDLTQNEKNDLSMQATSNDDFEDSELGRGFDIKDTSKKDERIQKGLKKKDFLNKIGQSTDAKNLEQAVSKLSETGALAKSIIQEPVPPSIIRLDSQVNPLVQQEDLAQGQKTEITIAQTVGSKIWQPSLGQRILWMANGDIKQASIHLDPPELGPLEVTLNMENDKAKIVFSSSHILTKEALETAYPKLKEMLGSEGIDLVDYSIELNQNATNTEANNREDRNSNGVFVPDNKIKSVNGDNLSANDEEQPTVRILNGLVDYYA